MGIFTYTDPHTNRVYNFEYGGSAPTEDDYAYARGILEQERAAYAQQYQQAFGEAAPEYDDGTAFGRGWDRATANLSGGIGELLQTTGNRLGWQGLEDYGTAKEAAAAERAGRLSLEQPAPMDWKDVRGLSSGLTYLGELAGGSAPVSLAGAAGMLGGALAAPALGLTGLGATALPLGAGALATLPSYAGENLQEQERQRGEGNVNLTAALGTAAVQSALDAAALRALGALGVGKSIFGGLSGDVGRGLGMRILTGGAEGALTEGGTEVLQEAATMLQAGIPLDSPEAQDRLVSALIGGGALGGFLGGAGRGAFGKRPETAAEPEVTPEIAGLLPPPLKALPAPTPEAPADTAAGTGVEAEPAPQQDEDIVELRGLFVARLQSARNAGATDEEARSAAARTVLSYIDILDAETQAKVQPVRDSLTPLVRPARNVRDLEVDERPFAPAEEPGAPAPQRPQVDMEARPFAPVGAEGQGADLFSTAESESAGPVDSSYTPMTEAEAFELAAQDAEAQWSRYRAEQARKAAEAKRAAEAQQATSKFEKNLKDLLSRIEQGRAAPEAAAEPVAETAPISEAETEETAPAPEPEAEVVTAPEPEPTGDPLADAASRMDEVRADIEALRARLPRGLFDRAPAKQAVDMTAARKAVVQAERLLKQATAAANKARAAIPKKNTHPIYKKRATAFYEASQAEQEATKAAVTAREALRAAEERSKANAAGRLRPLEALNTLPKTKQHILAALMAKMQEAANLQSAIDRLTADAAAKQAANTPAVPNLTAPVVPTPPLTWKSAPVPTTAMPDVRPKGLAGMPAAAAQKVREEAAYKELLGLFMRLAPEGMRKYTMARGGINNATTWESNPEWTTLEDKQAVIALLKRMSNAERAKYTKSMTAEERAAVPKLTEQENAAHTYFSKAIRPSDAIDMMIDDLTVDYDTFETQGAEAMSSRPEELARGTGRVPAAAALKWVEANLSARTNERVKGREAISARLDKVQEAWLDAEDKVATKRAARKAAAKVKRARMESDAIESGYIDDDTISYMISAAVADPMAAVDRTLHYTVRQALANGDLRTALRGLAATSPNATVRKIAAAFADRVGDTRVRLVDPTDGSADAKRLGKNAGAFSEVKEGQDPDMANVILLDQTAGMNVGTLLHEMAHAVTTHIVRWQPNHPITKQLQALLETLRKAAPEKPTETYPNGDPVYSYELYGLTNVYELVAETFGNAALDPTNSVLGQLMSRTQAGTFSSIKEEVPLTGLQRFLEIVSNMVRSVMGMPHKAWPRKTRVYEAPDTALDAVQRLVTGIMSPAKQSLPAHVVAQAAISPKIGINTINNALRSAPVWDAEGRKRFASNMNASMPEGLRRMLLGLLQLEWFADIARKYFPQVDSLKSIDDQKRGYISNLLGKFQALEDDLVAYGKASPEAFKMLMSVMGYSTRTQVDPTKPSDTYNGDPEKLAIWHEINAMMNKADGSGALRTLFKRVRNSNLAIRKEIEAALWQKAQQATPDKVAQKSLYQQLLEKITKEGVIEPYFALMREGDFWLTYQARDTVGPKQMNPTTGQMERPLTTFLQTFTSAWERDKFLTQLRAAKDENGNAYLVGNPDEFMKSDAFRADRSVQPEFLKGTMNIIDSLVPKSADGTRSAQADEAVSAIQDLFLKFTPEHSMLRSFMQRKGARGFVGDITPLGIIDSPHDMAETLARKTRSMVSQIAAIKYGSEVQRLRNEAIKAEKELQRRPDLSAGEKAVVKAYLAEFDARARAVQSPNISRTAQNVRTLTFAWTLGGNVSAAINALMQIPMVGYTHLLSNNSSASVRRQLGLATRLITNAGKNYRQVTYGADGEVVSTRTSLEHYGSIANYFEVAPDGKWRVRSDAEAQKILKSDKTRKVLQDMDTLVEYMSSNGMLTHSQMQEALIQENDWLAMINKWSGMPMHFAERYNRQALAIASYNLELDKMRAPDGSVTEDQKRIAAQRAVSDTELVNGSIGAATAPRHAQSAIGSVVFLYKRFGLSMARYIIKAVSASVGKVDENAPASVQEMQRRNRAIARYQLAGILGTSALFSGVQGLPFYGELMAIFNALFRDEDEEDFDTLLQKFVGEPFYHGALNYLTGAEIASRISLSGLIYRENRIQKDQSVLYDLVDTFGGPAVGTFQNLERGIGQIAQGDLYRGIETMLPSAIKNGFKSVRYATEGARTARGDEVVPLSYGDIALQLIGYTPATYARMQEFTSEERGIRNAITAEKSALYRRYYLASLERDAEEMGEVWKEMQEFSARHPDRAITPTTLRQSMAAYANRTEEMIGGVSFSRSDRPAVLQSQSEYDNPTAWSR